MGRVRTQTGRSNASGEGGSRSVSRAGERLEPIAHGGQQSRGGGLPPRPHSVAEGQLLRRSGAADTFTVPRTPMPQTRAHSRAGGEDGPASRLSTSRRKSIPKFIDDPPPTAPVGSEDENLESNLLALKRCRHKLNIYAGGAKRYFMSWSGNRDGQLDREELRKGFDAMNLGFDQNQVNFLVRAFDADKSNSVDFSEFCKTMELTDSELVSTVCNDSTNAQPKWMLPDTVSTVCHESMNAQPKWMLPEKWHFTSQDTGKIDKLKLDLQNRLHLNYGSDPMAMRRAQRCGMVTRGDLIHSFAALGLQVPDKDVEMFMSAMCDKKQEGGIPPHDVEMFMSAMCDKKEEGGIRYRSFLKYFEPGPVGSFNPFRPELPIDGSRPGAAKTSAEDVEEANGSNSLSAECPGAAKTSAEDVEEVKDVWQGCFGRDSRYRVVFPHLPV
ncbi:hypothetical protein T484DRAFT_1769305 [Baffinella frigidus]|nr:hypothetical protein T484DRAFT_1769305 [Cryptophyta sp. CCMP2293]